MPRTIKHDPLHRTTTLEVRSEHEILYVCPNGAVDRSGIVTPSGTHVFAEDANTITVKVPGHGYWAGHGLPQGYAQPELRVYIKAEVTEYDGDRRSILGALLTSVNVGRKK